MDFVLDASVALAWPTNGDLGQISQTDLLEALPSADVAVPDIFLAETVNVLLRQHRQRRGDDGVFDRQVEMLKGLPLEIDQQTLAGIFSKLLPLARRHRLSLFDAAYLELAIRLSQPLATFDAALVRAAKAESVTILS